MNEIHISAEENMMLKSVERKIRQLIKEGVPEDFLRDAAESYSINDDGEPATAQYIINGLETEAEKFREIMKEG